MTTLTIDINEIEHFCQRLMSESRCAETALAALQGVELFVTAHAQVSDDNAEYQSILSFIAASIKQCHQQVLEKHRQDVLQAIKQCNIAALAIVFSSQSRHNFLQIIHQVIADLSDDEIALLMLWSENWMKEAAQLTADSEINQHQLNCMRIIDRVFNATE